MKRAEKKPRLSASELRAAAESREDAAALALRLAVQDTLALETHGYRVELYAEYEPNTFTVLHVQSGKVFTVTVEEL